MNHSNNLYNHVVKPSPTFVLTAVDEWLMAANSGLSWLKSGLTVGLIHHHPSERLMNGYELTIKSYAFIVTIAND